jgi:DNA-binding NarL/FixJ family response regulator
VRVAVRSGQDIVRVGVESMLGDVSACVEVVAPHEHPDVLLYDVFGLYEGDAQDLELAVKRHPGRVLALSRDLQPGLAAQAMAIGAIGTVSIGASRDELVEMIAATASGRLQDGSSADLANQAERERTLGRDVHLTERERQVLALIVAGASNKEVATELFLTINTVKSVIRSAYAKTGATTRAQAVAWGMEHGFRPQVERG